MGKITRQLGVRQRFEVAAIVKAGKPVDRRERLQIAGVLFGQAAFAHRLRQPAQQQQAEHHATGKDIEDFRHDEKDRLTQEGRHILREKAVPAAEIKSEIDGSRRYSASPLRADRVAANIVDRMPAAKPRVGHIDATDVVYQISCGRHYHYHCFLPNIGAEMALQT
jgi:hypothetical protein